MTTIQFGNKEITITLTAGSEWKAEGIERVYYDIEVDGKARPLAKFYEVISGATKDKTVTVGDRTFAYQYGFCDSKTKRAAVDAAAAELAARL